MHQQSGRSAELIKPLTSIRFFAALAVVIFHSGASWASVNPQVPGPVKTLLLNGYVGVTFFFVLSGFILHQTYRGRIASGEQVKRFAVARFARLYPVYVVAVLAMLPFTTLAGWGDVPQFFLLHWWIPNGALGWTDWNMPSWTLSVEFFFYLCFPLISRAVAGIGTRWLLVAIIALLGFDLVTAASAVVANDEVLFAWMRWTPVPLLRLPEFVIGVCSAEIVCRGNKVAIPSWIPALALVAGLCVSGDPRMAAFATAMAVLLIAAIVSDRESAFAKALSVRWLVILGGASYALYLLHQPVHFGVLTWLGSAKTMIVLQYPMLIVGSIVVFLFYEEPAREWIRAQTRLKPSVMEQVAENPLHSENSERR
jgi:peptidoglycan/LPS O-acetylase OafA/YrhL